MTVSGPRRLRQRTALVAGGAGFIGSHLCDALLSRGLRVVCVDSFLTGRRRNAAALQARSGFALVEHDVVSPLRLDVRVDLVFNLACPASPPHYQADPVHTLLTSVVGTSNLLALTEANGARFLQASTSEVYGDPLEHPQREAYWGHVNPIGPRACYDEGKRAAETLCFDILRTGQVDARVARIFNTYGPRMRPDDGRVVSNLIVQALTGQPLTVFGSGAQTRSFCYVSDLVDGLVALMDTESNPGRPVNLGNPAEFTITELVDMVRGLIPGARESVALPLPVDDPRRRCPDITGAASLLGWAPSVSLADGLPPTIAWFARELGQPRRPPRRYPERVAQV